MPERNVLFGASLGEWNGAAVANAGRVVQLAAVADDTGLDLVTIADHPYFADRLDAYATLGFVLGRTERIAGCVAVTNAPCRPAPGLARTLTALSELSGERVIFGVGAGAIWDEIVKLGVPRLDRGAAVRAMAESIRLVRALTGGGDPVTYEGECYQVRDLAPAAARTPPIWTGSVGPKSLAVTGQLADGWVPSGGADWLSPVYQQGRPIINEAAAAAGRHPADVATIFNFGGRITDEPLETTRTDEGRWIGGSAEQWVAEMTAGALEYGASGFIFRNTDAETPAEVALERFALEVVPAVRAAVAAD